jgi:hypothetical protein
LVHTQSVGATQEKQYNKAEELVMDRASNAGSLGRF